MGNIDSSYSLYTVHDAVHGTIDFKSFENTLGISAIVKLLNTKIIQRLRNIKQLGYASHSHPAADHSRYAHAIGTMFIMKGLLDRFKNSSPEKFNKISNETLKYFEIKNSSESILIKHMLLAGLLQDIGELPFGQATESVFIPDENMVMNVKNNTGSHNNDWSNKDIFTTYSIFNDDELYNLLQKAKINLSFLIYLITGHINDDKIAKSPLPLVVSTFRQLIDGSVDADRLDYVYRDGHHAFGGMGSPSSVIVSLLYYDENGPVFSDPGPISEFIIKRAHLWRTVYFSPVNRFRVALLKTFLKGVFSNENYKKIFLMGGEKEGLNYESFKKLEDISLTNRLIQCHEGKYISDLRIKSALDLLLTQSPEFTCFWLPPPQSIKSKKNGNLSLPDYFFYDTFSNYNSNINYEQRIIHSIRIKDDKFKYISKNPINITLCTGGLLSVAESDFSAVPIKNGILIFQPKEDRKKIGASWKKIEETLKENSLYNELIIQDIKSDLNAPADTLNISGFKGKKIFISYAFEDYWLVKKIVQILYNKKRKYIAIIDPFQGLSGTPIDNSVEAVENCERFLVIASSNWIKKQSDYPNGPIAAEVTKIRLLVETKYKNHKPVVLSVNNHEENEREFPYLQLGFRNCPYLGKGLENSSNSEMKEAITEALKKFDK